MLAFCAANPQLNATILDFPQTVEMAKKYAWEAGLTDRVAHLAGDAVTTEWPAEHDVVLMSYVWSSVGGADISVLERRAFDALPSGGLVLVHDFMVDNAYEQSPFAAWYLLGSVFDNPNAVCLTPAFVEDALRQVGFEIDATEVMLPGIAMLTKACKPGWSPGADPSKAAGRSVLQFAESRWIPNRVSP